MKTFTAFIRGDIHDRTGTPCQDAHSIVVNDEITFLAVADGHGGAPYCRSDRGAKFACNAAAETLLNSTDMSDIPSQIKKLYDEMVNRDLEAEPFDPYERERTENIRPQDAYGSTCLAVAVRNGETDAFQLGDGSIFFLDDSARFLDILPEDEDCFGNYTSGMTYDPEEAVAHFRHMHFDFVPSVIIMFTDGYASPFNKPYEIAAAIVDSETLSDVIVDGIHGDDLSLIIAYDEEAVHSEKFLRGIQAHLTAMETETEKMRVAEEIRRLEQKKRSLEEYLKIANDTIDDTDAAYSAEKTENLKLLKSKREKELEEIAALLTNLKGEEM